MAGADRAALTAREIISSCPTPRGRNESDDDLLRRISHVNLQQKGIATLDGIGSCHNLRTLYAYDNTIMQMSSDLVMLPRLSHLYLQNNPLTQIASLDKSSKLQKLFLDGCGLSIISGLSACTALTELHVSGQEIDQPLQFEEASMLAIAGTLKTLSCADNGLEDLRPLAPLWALRTVDLRNNALQSVSDLEPLLGSAMGLRELSVQGNPGTSPGSAPLRTRVRDALILMAGQRLQMLDGAEVTDNQRHFIYAREMKRQGLPVPGAGGGAGTRGGGRGSTVHKATGHRDVRGVAGGGWRGSKGKLQAPPHGAHRGAGGGATVPSFSAASAAAVPGGRPMPKEGVQRTPPVRGGVDTAAASGGSGGQLPGLALTGVAHGKTSSARE